MPKKTPEMTVAAVSRLSAPGRHSVGGVPGLMLYLKNGQRYWVLRVLVGGKRHDYGLGTYPEVSVAQARDKARRMHDQLQEGVEVPTRQVKRREIAQAVARRKTFKDVAEQFIGLQRPGWKNPKHAQQWENTLSAYAYPVLGELPVGEVSTAHVLEVLAPIWSTKTETASRLRQRIEAVLDFAKTQGLREGDNPAAWRGNLQAALPNTRKVSKVEHHAALPWRVVPEAWQRIAQVQGMGARALQFAILTATRSGEVRGATWQEIDLEARLWTIPQERMKGGRAHRVPLSDSAVTLLKSLPRIEGENLVFPSTREGKPLSDMTLLAVCRRLNLDCVPHGFRSSFRQWATDQRIEHELAERCLAHLVGSAVSRAYDRGDALEAREPIMQQWAQHVTTEGRGG